METFRPEWGQSSTNQASDKSIFKEWNSTSTLKRKHVETGLFDQEYMQGRCSPPLPTPPILHPPGSASVIEFREGDRIPISVDFDLESPEDCLRVSNRILRSLLVDDWKSDFKAHHIPSRQRDPEVHHQLHALLTKRTNTETALETLLTDEHPDDRSKDREERSVDREYNHLSGYYYFLNRSMLTIYAEYLVKPVLNPRGN
jgi:hypothetical protein